MTWLVTREILMNNGPITLVLDSDGSMNSVVTRRMFEANSVRERIIIVDGCRMTPGQINMMMCLNRVLIFETESFKAEHYKKVGEMPKQIKYGPQRNIRKGKQRRW